MGFRWTLQNEKKKKQQKKKKKKKKKTQQKAKKKQQQKTTTNKQTKKRSIVHNTVVIPYTKQNIHKIHVKMVQKMVARWVLSRYSSYDQWRIQRGLLEPPFESKLLHFHGEI